MDRGKRSSLFGHKGKPAGEKNVRGGFGQRTDPRFTDKSSKFGGRLVAPAMGHDDESLVIDPNLLVGPLYVPKTTRTDRIKEQIGDITEKLHKTLYAFDEFTDFEHEDPVVGLMRQQIGNLEDTEMKNNLAFIMDQYEDMTMQVSDANRERDDMLLQLADWFTTDHVDLEDIKASIDESEEQNIKQSYFDTVTNFEKLKKLQSQILKANQQGKSTRQLHMKKAELEKDVVDKFKVMKDMSMQTMKLKVSDDAPWKHAAQEIVSMLKNVRTENAEELQAIPKKMQDMIDQLEKQALLIKSLRAELREKKEVCKQLTDENGDLSQDVALFRARYTRYEKELEQAKQMIRSLHQEKLAEKDGVDTTTVETAGRTLTESISKVISLIEEPAEAVKSDAEPLRAQLREYQNALECIRSEYSRSAEEVEELNIELQEKKEYISNIEVENEKLVKDIRKLRQERRQSIAAGTLIPPPGEGHKCEHCNCHIPEKDPDEEIDELKTEVQKWQDKCNYFKKCLADTELKLSDAYKEISALRMERDLPPPTQPNDTPSEAKEIAKKASRKATEPVKASDKDKGKEKEEKAPAPKPKQKREVKARYMQQTSRQDRQRLPPIERHVDDRHIVDDRLEEQTGLTPKQSRELKLYKVGDLQGILNMLVTEIMDFVTEIGKILYKEKEDDGGKFQSMKAFTFDNNVVSKKEKEVRDSKEEEDRQKKSQVIFNGQHACAKLRESFDCLSSSIELQHNEYEEIYRSFKISQQRNTIRREVIMGRMPITALQEFDGQQMQRMRESEQDNLLGEYYNITYGGATTSAVANKPRHGTSLHKKSSSIFSLHADAEESETKLKNTRHVLAMQRSRSDLDTRDTSSYLMGALTSGGILHDKDHLNLMNLQDLSRHREPASKVNKQEMEIGMAVIPRKGQIALQTADSEVQRMGIQGEKRRSAATPSDTSSAKTKSLITRNDILEHIKAGTKLLEHAEENKHQEEEIAQSLGDYTILDLQSKLLEMTDAKSLRRKPKEVGKPDMPSQQKRPGPAAPEKGITLPAIKNINPFKM